MTPEKIKRMMDACYQAKRIRELLPPLPSGVTPAYIQYMDVMNIIQASQGYVKISDVSDYLKLPRPGVTRTINEMVRKGYLKKLLSEEDKRVIYISITEAGQILSQKYDADYYNRLCPYLEHISDEEADCMIETIEKLYTVMSEGRVEIE